MRGEGHKKRAERETERRALERWSERDELRSLRERETETSSRNEDGRIRSEYAKEEHLQDNVAQKPERA